MFDINGYFETKSVAIEFDASNENKPNILCRWSSYTEGLDDLKKKTLSILLENQWIIDNMSTNEISSCSAELVTSMYKPFIQLDICTVIPMLGPTLLYQEYFKARTRKMAYVWKFEAQPSSRMSPQKIHEGNISVAKTELFNELFNEVYEDLKNNVSITRNNYTTDYVSAIEQFLIDLAEMKKPSEQAKPQWMIVNNKLAELMTGETFTSKVPEKVGVFKDMAVIRSPILEENQVLFGRKDCYVHACYIPLTISPVILDPDTFEPRKSFMIRYDKKLLTSKGLSLLTFHKQTTAIK